MSDPIILRAASGASVGLGHVMRSRAVAQALARLGEPALLLVDDPATVRLFAGEGFEVSQADPEGHWLEAPARAVWLDGFRPWTEELERLAARGVSTWTVSVTEPGTPTGRFFRFQLTKPPASTPPVNEIIRMRGSATIASPISCP